MCGIAGHISFNSSSEPSKVQNMIKSINHRGPDDWGVWTSMNSLCTLGHARLSIIDLSPLGHQPMVDKVVGNSIVFNGEIYNFRELRKFCESKGEVFNSNSDTEVILALYKIYGPDCLLKLRGMYAFAIWDEQKQQLFFARDRVGKKPFNYVFNETGFSFCSEIHPLITVSGISKEEDPEAKELFLQLQYVPAPYTIYKSVRKLPQASYGIYDRNGLHIHSYWDVSYNKKIKISEADALDALAEKLSDAIRLRMISDVPLGAMLSGGVDSSLVVALMSKLSGSPIRTYSIGFEDEKFNELPFAKFVADSVGSIHHEEVIKGNVVELLPKMIQRYGEPFADPSSIPSFFVCNYARRHVTVALNGDGGDELLGGYPRYNLSPFQMKYSSLFGNFLSPDFVARYGIKFSYKTNSPIKKLAGNLLLNLMRPELASLTFYNPFFNNRIRKRVLIDFNEDSFLKWAEDIYERACKNAKHPIDRMLYFDSNTYLPGDLLVKMDIASMNYGLEARSPFLDHEIIEFCASLPASLKSHHGQGKYLLKKLAERYFPNEFIYRKKMGFQIPLFKWIKGPLNEMLIDTLKSDILMDSFRRDEIDLQLNPLLEGKDHTCPRLWTLFMYGLWKKECLLK